MLEIVFPLAVVFVALFVVLALFISRYLIICQPNEVVILSGRRRQLPDGGIVGYRVIRGGRALRIPVIEKAARMSLETFPLELSVTNAYSKGGIPLKVEAIANVKIQSDESALGNAVERFLSLPEPELQKIAKDTLEGNLRGVLATLTPEEVNEDRLKFAQSLIDEADQDLKQMGLQLDTLKIQNVHDDAGYLDSIGRKKTAEVLAAGRMAEAERAAEAEEAEAEARRRAQTAKAVSDQRIQAAEIDADQQVKTARADADQEIAIARNNLRMKEAELEKEAVIKDQEAQVAGEKAKAQFEQSMEEERIILQQKRLMADVIEPARARRESMEEEAKGQAAPILEEGRARIQILDEMVRTYQSADGEGEKVFMLNMLPEIISQLTDTVSRLSIDKVTVIDSGSSDGNGHGVGRFVNQLPGAVISLAEQIETATGVNILNQFKDRATATPNLMNFPNSTPQNQGVEEDEVAKEG